MLSHFFRWLSSEVLRGEQLGMAMAGVGLRERIGSILQGARNARVSRTRVAVFAILIGGAAAVLSTGELAHAEQPLPAFDVATVKPAEPGATGMRLGMPSPGRIAMSNMTLLDMIRFAYGQGLAANLPISGGPDWMGRDHYNIDAQAPSTMASPNMDQLRLMLRALLTERFALKLHNGTKEADVYAMVLARSDRKLGPKLQLWDGDCNGRNLPAAQPDSKVPRCSGLFGPTGLTVKGGSMAALADMLSTQSATLGRPVVDRTGLSGEYQLELEFQFPRSNPGGGPPPADPSEGPSIFTALQEQLGLKLESARAAVETLVIDSAGRPSEN